MGFMNNLKKARENYAKKSAERKGYRKIVSEKTTLAARQAYSEEAIKVARERARAKARAPTLGQRLARAAQNTAQPRTIARPKYRRTKSVKRIKSSKKKRKVRYAAAPQEKRQAAPSSLNHAIYGGY